MAILPENQSTILLLDDALFCEEEDYVEDENKEEEFLHHSSSENSNGAAKRGVAWEEEELISLFAKEEEQHRQYLGHLERDKGAVEWILKVNARYGFSSLTAMRALNYFDRFLLSKRCITGIPWLIHLAVVACLSLAAKVEETDVPRLLDLQVEETQFFFEAKSVQRMELLVLATLQWKMHSVTPISFLDHIVRRLGVNTHLQWEFATRCEHVLLSLVSDSRSVSFLPSELATSAMVHVVDQLEPLNSQEYRNQLLAILKTSEDKVNECCSIIPSHFKTANGQGVSKRKFHPETPRYVIDAAIVSSDASADSWMARGDATSSNVSSKEIAGPRCKKSKTEDQWW